MSFDYSAAKAAIAKAGHTVSTGPNILATDIKELVKFGRRMFGLNEVAVRKGIANPTLLPEGFPGAVAAPVTESAPEAAPVAVETPAEVPVTPDAVAPQDAPVQDSTPAEDAQKGKKTKKADESVPADAPAQDAPAQDAPAAGEQAAQ